MTTCIGIDFGTSNSVIIAMPPDGSPQPVKSLEGDVLIPSAIFYPDNSQDKILVGKAALAMLPNDNVVRFPKRGTGLTIAAAKKRGLVDTFNAKIAEVSVSTQVEKTASGKPKKGSEKAVEKEKAEKEKVEKIRFLIHQDGKTRAIAVETVISDMISHFVSLVQANHGNNVSYVFSRPQYYGPIQAEVFKNAVSSAIGSPDGLTAILTEPVAATFSYQALKELAPEKKRLLTLDVGGGTFDISFLEKKGAANYQGLCTGGDDFLGGCDQDREFLSTMELEMKTDPTFKKDVFNERRTEFLAQLKDMKHNLAMTSSTVKIVVYGCTDKPFNFCVDEEKKKQILQPFYQAIEKTVNDCFERKGKTIKKTGDELKRSVQVVYAVGGPTRDKTLVALFEKMFEHCDVIGKPGTAGSLNPDEVVAYGNAFWCSSQKKISTKIGLPKDPKHRGVLSKSLGIEGVMPGRDGMVSRFCPIIHANTQLPACGGEQNFGTSENNQDSILIKVYQGEGEFTDSEGVEYIGKYTVPLRQPNKIDEIGIDVMMEVTKANLLIVKAGERGKLKEQQFDLNI